ncbi:MAG: hypothetical protein VCD00_14875 [Candidatus Hydrogenedentota bacterium]
MSDTMYLTIMLGLLGILIVILVPTMFRTRCRACGTWNKLDAKECRGCHAMLPD